MGEGKRRKKRRDTDKGALYSKYSKEVHQWLTHLRRVHVANQPATIGSLSVKASDPFAPDGCPLYYCHSKTAMYNDFFFQVLGQVFCTNFQNHLPGNAN